jgi:hypothetical protein
MDQSRFANGVEMWGLQPALHMLTRGALLASLDHIATKERLVEKLRRRDDAAWAELNGIWLLGSGDAAIQIELEPDIPDWSRVPDFSARRNGDLVYVEVSQPNTSEMQRRLREIMADFTALLDALDGQYALELFLRREPTDVELDRLRHRVPEVCAMTGLYVEELPEGLGGIYLNETIPGIIEPRDHGEDYRPRLGSAKSWVEDGMPRRHISVRLAYSDERAEAFLTSEARQLPKTAPGLIMIQTTGAIGAFKLWEPLLVRRLQPNIHTRVSGICLFESGMLPSDAGLTWRPETRVIDNPNAKLPLPAWVATQLERFSSAS